MSEIKITKVETIGEIPFYLGAVDETTRNKWICQAYSDLNSIGQQPTLDWIEGLEIIREKKVADEDTSLKMGMGNRTTTLNTTYVNFSEDNDYTTTIRIDDVGLVVINDVNIITTSKSDITYDVTFPFKKGWNKIEILVKNATGGDGFLIEPRIGLNEYLLEMTFDKNATISKSYIEDTKEAELQKISIRPQYVNRNIVGKDMFLENYEVHKDVLDGKVELLEPTKGGIFRMKYETTAEFKKQNGHPNVYAYKPKESRRPFLFKPHTKYTYTYYVHEATNPKSGYPDIICMAGDGYSHVSETLGLRTATVTSTAQAPNGGGLFHIMIAGPDTSFKEGERRCYDVELISVVEGETAQQIPGPYFPMTGTKEGLTLTTQDHLPKLGEYRLDGDIPEIINSVENIIEKNENELEISWI